MTVVDHTAAWHSHGAVIVQVLLFLSIIHEDGIRLPPNYTDLSSNQ